MQGALAKIRVPRQGPGPRIIPGLWFSSPALPVRLRGQRKQLGAGGCGGLGLSRGRGILAGVLLRGARGPSRGLREGSSGLGTASELPSECSEQEAQGTAWGARATPTCRLPPLTAGSSCLQKDPPATSPAVRGGHLTWGRGQCCPWSCVHACV